MKCTDPEISFFYIDEHWKHRNLFRSNCWFDFFCGWCSVLCCVFFSLSHSSLQILSIGFDFDPISFGFVSLDVFFCHFRPRFYDVDEWQDETKTVFHFFRSYFVLWLLFYFKINVQTTCHSELFMNKYEINRRKTERNTTVQRHIDALLKVYMYTHASKSNEREKINRQFFVQCSVICKRQTEWTKKEKKQNSRKDARKRAQRKKNEKKSKRFRNQPCL